MDEKIKKKFYNEVENPWDFVIKVSRMYKDEFRKTSKIGNPPKIDDIIEKALADDTEEVLEAEEPILIKEDKPAKKSTKKTAKKK